MKDLAWYLVKALAKAIPRQEREAVLGDLVELRLSGRDAVVDVASVIVSRAGRGAVTAARILVLALAITAVFVAVGDWIGFHVTTAE